ncbi:MAG: four helix bundle protein [Hyphomicrobiaceae bacterium]|nr:four helix bundle protein [Hyphomicrobiaceae bacterium]
MAIASYQDLDVWQVAMDLAAACYKLTEAFPKHEQFAMTSQIRRAAVSVPANIAEGYGRDTRAMYVQFLRISQGSIRELETLLLLCERVQLAAASRIQLVMDLTIRVSKMLRSLIRSLESK